MPTALLLLDVQRNMLEGDTAAPDAERLATAVEFLLVGARSAGALVVHVQNDGPIGSVDEPFSNGWQLVHLPSERESVLRKAVPDAFAADPQLAGRLRDRQVDTVVLAGLQSEYCVQATAGSAVELGFVTVLAAGAHGTYDDGEAAADIAERVESELEHRGVIVTDHRDIEF